MNIEIVGRGVGLRTGLHSPGPIGIEVIADQIWDFIAERLLLIQAVIDVPHLQNMTFIEVVATLGDDLAPLHPVSRQQIPISTIPERKLQMGPGGEIVSK